jgi:membrane peptidoglycan carboxypeptidase
MQVSANAPYVQLGMDVGTDKVKEAAMSAGLLETGLETTNSPTFSIGTSHPSAIRMADAYSTFANRGQQNDPYSVKKVVYDSTTVIEHKAAPKTAFSEAIADNVTDVLKNVVDNGTGTSAQLSGREVAGKTGTTDGNKSAWFIGYTPQLTTSIVMFRFNDNAKKASDRKFLEMYGTYGKDKIHGASFPAEIWHDYMAVALKNTPSEDFPTPEKLGTVVYGGGASSPSPSASASASISASPSITPSKTATQSATPTATATNTCSTWDVSCNDGGSTSSASPSSSTSTDTSNGNQNGSGSGGLLDSGGTG